MKSPVLHIIYCFAGIFAFIGYVVACSVFPKVAFWSAVLFGGAFIFAIAWKALDLDNVEDFEPENEEE